MIDLYYCPTPNCQKVSIALEELGLPYQVLPPRLARAMAQQTTSRAQRNRAAAIARRDE